MPPTKQRPRPRFVGRASVFVLLLVAAPPALAIPVPPDVDRLTVTSALTIREDPGGALTIEEVRRSPDQMQPASSDALNLGLSASAWWARLELSNPSHTSLERFLVFEWPLTDELTIYTEGPTGAIRHELGDWAPYTARPIDYRNPVLPIRLEAGETRTLWLRFAGADALVVSLVIASGEGLAAIRVADAYRFGAYYCLLAVMFTYNVFFFFATRDRSYWLLAMILVTGALWQLSIEGLAYKWLWPQSPWFANRAPGLFGALTASGFAAFTRSFLLTRRYAPRLDRVLGIIAYAMPVLLGIGLLGARFTNAVALPVGVALFSASILAAFRAMRADFPPGRDYLVIFSFALVCLSIYGVDATFGVVQNTAIQVFGLQIGFLGSLLLLNFALSRRITVLEEESQRVERLRQEKAAADRTSLEKSSFLATASHDLRQPVHALGFFIDSLADRVADPGTGEIVSQIQSAHHSMEEMLNSVLDLSRLDAGALTAEMQPIAVRDVMAPLASEFRPQAERAGLRFRVAPTSLAVRSDPTLLVRILRNLVSNALNYTERGGIVVGARRVGTTRVRIEVHDTGPGIPEDRQRDIFREYSRATERTQGLGLGLAIVDRLSTLLGHAVHLRSAPGRGTTFGVTLERVPPIESATAADAYLAAGTNLDGRVVMVVDDDPQILDGVRDVLSRWGCSFLGARDVEEARRKAEGLDLDIVLADLDLGNGASGLDVIDTVRRATRADLPAALISGDTSARAAARARARHLVLLHKPLSPAKLRATLTGLLDAARGLEVEP